MGGWGGGGGLSERALTKPRLKLVQSTLNGLLHCSLSGLSMINVTHATQISTRMTESNCSRGDGLRERAARGGVWRGAARRGAI